MVRHSLTVDSVADCTVCFIHNEYPCRAQYVSSNTSHITPSVSLSLAGVKAANSIQRIKKDSSHSEHQPPPYQDERSAARRSSRSRPERGVRRGSSPQRCDSARCSSEASVDQDTESYLNKGCEEDIPSDSTAVLGQEVRTTSLCVLISVSSSGT